MRLMRFDDYLYRKLQDSDFAAAYLEAALEDSPDEFLIAMRKYIQANGGMTQCAEQTELKRESIYRMLSPTGNPSMRSLSAILRAHGLRFSIQQETVKAES